MSALLLVLVSSRAFGSDLACEGLFQRRDSHGHIPNFVRFFEPVFNSSDLERKMKTVGRRNENFLIANGNSEGAAWFAEARVFRGEIRIAAAKYTHHIHYESQTLLQMQRVFSRLDLLRYFDVLTPLRDRQQVGYALFPYLEARSLRQLTARANYDDGILPLEDYQKGRDGGPPEQSRHTELARLWSIQQARIKAVSEVLKTNGFRVEEFYQTSVNGKPYLWLVVVRSPENGGQFGFSLRSDVLVTTDGRFVISDPE